MMILEANIYLDKPTENPYGLPYDLNTSNVIRPSINFGNDILLSGTIRFDENIKILTRGKYYTVTIEMPTVEEEAFDHILDLVYFGGSFTLQSRVISF